MPLSDYSPRDYDSLLARSKALAAKWFLDENGRPLWTDFDAPTVENFLMKNMCWHGDLLGFQRDMHRGETFVDTVRRRANFLRIARLFNYPVAGPAPASVDVTLSLAVAITKDITVPEGTVLPYGSIQYRTDADATILAGGTSVAASAVQYEERSETFNCDERAWQRRVLMLDRYVAGSLALTTAAGTWTQATDNSFVGYGPTDRVYKLSFDERFRAVLDFGDGVTGAAPDGTATAAYHTTQGTAGSVSAGRLRGAVTVNDDGGTPRAVSYLNALGSSGASNGESTGEGKARLPGYARSSEALVTREDYEALAMLDASVGAAFLLTKDDSDNAEAGAGVLYVIAKGTEDTDGYIPPATPAGAVLTDLAAEMALRRMTGFQTTAAAALSLTVDVATIIYASEDYDEPDAAGYVHTALTRLFSVQNPDGSFGWARFGVEYPLDDMDPTYRLLRWSDILNAIRDAEGVDRISPDGGNLLLNGLHEDPRILPWQFPKLGEVRVTNIRTGNTFTYPAVP